MAKKKAASAAAAVEQSPPAAPSPPAPQPLGGLPPSMKIQHVIAGSGSLPPEVQERLDSALKSGRYSLCIVEANEAGDLHVYSFNSEGFNKDWKLRAWQEHGRQIMAFDPPVPTVPQAASGDGGE